MKTALVAGATGLVGGQVVNLLLDDPRYKKVIVLVRRPLPTHPKLEQLTIDLGNGNAYADISADDVFCCLGTTIKVAGSQENFRKVDYEYPVALARAMKQNGAKQYLIVSALGANSKSSIFYNRVKGEVEEGVSKVGFYAVHILRPSLIMGERKEKRSSEDAAKWVYKYLGWLIPAKYKGIDFTKIAKAMVAFASQPEHGIFIHESDVLQKY